MRHPRNSSHGPASVGHLFRLVSTATVLLALAGCKNQSAGPPPFAAQKVEVGVVTLHPRSVAITAELPGRTVASFTAEVRPQVDGIVRERLYKEGGEVAKGDALYQIDPATYRAAYDSAVASVAKAEAAVPSAQSKVDRYRSLVGQNAVAKQDFDDALASLAEANADVGVAKAAMETAKINLDHTRIVAPIAGRIDKSTLTPGALVTASQTTALTTIRTIDPINVDITQSSTRQLELRRAIAAGRVRLSGGSVSVRLVLDDGTAYPLPGTLAFRESNVSETTGTFTLRAEFPNPDRLLLPGMYVRARVEEGIAENSFLVPQRAVSRNTKGEATAFFVTSEGKIEQRVLQVSSSIGNNWLVPEGIADGERVVVEGSIKVRPGQDVSAVEVVIDENSGEVRERSSGALDGAADVAAAARPATARAN